MEALIPKPRYLWGKLKPSEWGKLKPSEWGKLKPSEGVKLFFFTFLAILVFLVCFGIFEYNKFYAPDITIPSMDFTVLNMTETRLSVKWDLLIRIIPQGLPGIYVCREGDFKVFILYKGVTIATSSMESYTLKPTWDKLLIQVSLIASEGDMDGAIVKNIVDDIMEKGEIRFGSRLLLPDCRSETSGKMNYTCDVATLRFEPGSKRSATLFGSQPNCLYHPQVPFHRQ